MAKGKNAAALFEVIGKSKGIKPAAPRGGLNTPRWWFKGTRSVQGDPAPARVEEATPAPPPAPTPKPERTKLGPMTALRPPAPSSPPTPTRPVESPDLSPSAPISDPTDAKPIRVDPDRQEIRLRLSYTSAAVIAFALLATVAVAVIIGRSMGTSAPAGSQTTTVDLLAGPANPDVLNARPGQGKLDFIDNDPVGLAAVPRTPQTAEGGMASRVGPDARQASEVTPGPGSVAAGSAPVTSPAGRVVGINYFIVQSYPDERDARAVVDLLARHGIPTTIERNLPGYPRWYIVVTSQGFTSLRAPEAEALRRRIDQISADQARTDRRWKPLTPQGYRWR